LQTFDEFDRCRLEAKLHKMKLNPPGALPFSLDANVHRLQNSVRVSPNIGLPLILSR
jgi:hypothetical protein